MTKEEYKELLSIRDREFLENLLYECKFERTCESCKHHFSQTENYGNCERNGTPEPTEYTWFCAGWEIKE